MVAEQMRKLIGYNQWAWRRVFASVEKLDPADYHAERALFQGSIHGTLVHSMAAEWIWLSRCQGESPTALFDPHDYADFTAVEAAWREIFHKWANTVQWLDDAQCARMVDYRNTRGSGFALALVDIIQHVANHAIEHRSQLTPILAGLGAPTQPLDYMLFMVRGR
jgi:uncharacterized damage-inducible protein DinB